MIRMLFSLLVVIGGVFLIAHFLPGVKLYGTLPALIVALLLSVANTFVRPVLKFIAFPVNLLTLGLFTFVIDAGVLWFIARLVDGFEVHGFTSALLGAAAIGFLSVVSDKFADLFS